MASLLNSMKSIAAAASAFSLHHHLLLAGDAAVYSKFNFDENADQAEHL